jgi:hypothetical protein
VGTVEGVWEGSLCVVLNCSHSPFIREGCHGNSAERFSMKLLAKLWSKLPYCIALIIEDDKGNMKIYYEFGNWVVYKYRKGIF